MKRVYYYLAVVATALVLHYSKEVSFTDHMVYGLAFMLLIPLTENNRIEHVEVMVSIVSGIGATVVLDVSKGAEVYHYGEIAMLTAIGIYRVVEESGNLVKDPKPDE